MMEKISEKTSGLTGGSLFNFRPGLDLTDATRLYRKEEALKKKLKVVLQNNSQLQKQIRVHQTEIRDQRASVQFQLGDLIKQMGIKFGLFTEQKLQREHFENNVAAHRTMQGMMQKYDQIQKECLLMGKIYDSLRKVDSNYQTHAREMENLVVESEEVSQEYQQTMENTIHNICEETKVKTIENKELDETTQEMVREIDQFIEGRVELLGEEERIMAKIDKLKRMANCQQQKVNQISEWAQIVIDKSNRKTVQKTMNQKQGMCSRMSNQNNQLEIYLFQLSNEEQKLLRDKENMLRQKSKEKNRRGGSKAVTRKVIK